MMAIKADIVLATEMQDFWPEEARNQCKLLPKHPAEYGVRFLARGNTWRPSSCLQEGVIMRNLPLVPKFAYVLAKIANSVLMYTKEELPYKVKSYDIKNALLHYMADDDTDKEGLGPEIRGQALPGEDIMGKHIKKVYQWTHYICREGLRSLIYEDEYYDNGPWNRLKAKGINPYYFGMGRSRMKTNTVDKLCAMVDAMLPQNL